MNWWPVRGIAKRLTEPHKYTSTVPVESLPGTFKRSLFVYPLDLGNSNALNMDISALKAPQYNPHRIGVFFAATPRHADVLLLLGTPIDALREVFAATLEQVPRPYGAVWIPDERVDARPTSTAVANRKEPDWSRSFVEQAVTEAGGTLIATIEPYRGPEDILGVLRTAMRGRSRK